MTRFFLLSLSALAMPALAGAQSLAGRTDSVFTWRGALAPHAVLHVQNFNGAIDVRPASGSNVELRAVKQVGGKGTIQDIAFDIRTAQNGDVSICSTNREHNPCADDHRLRWHDGDEGGRKLSVSMTVLVPRGAEVRLVSGNGAISVEQVGGVVDATTGNGAVRVKGTDGAVGVRTGNGRVEVLDANARVHASTGNGRVSVTTGAGPVDASSGNGDIDVRIGRAGERAPMTLSTGNGSVHLDLPATFNGELDASTGHGRVRSDFSTDRDDASDRHRMHATIGTGGPVIRASTGNGSIEVRRISP